MTLKDYISRLSDNYGIPSQLSFAIAAVESDTNLSLWDVDPTWQWLWDCPGDQKFRRLADEEVLSCCAPDGFKAMDSTGVQDDDREYIGQKIAWGPFGMRGAHLRAVDFPLDFLAMCEDPNLSVHYFLRHMQELQKKYHVRHGWAGVVAAYHSGRPRMSEDGVYENVEYVARVARAVPNLRGMMPFRT